MNKLINQMNSNLEQTSKLLIDVKQLREQTKDLSKALKDLESQRGGYVRLAVTQQEPLKVLEELMDLASYKDRQKAEYKAWYRAYSLKELSLKEWRKEEKELQQKLKKVNRETIQKEQKVSKHTATAIAKETKEAIREEHYKAPKNEQNAENKKLHFARIETDHTARGALTADSIKQITTLLKENGLTEQDIELYVKQTAPKQIKAKSTVKRAMSNEKKRLRADIDYDIMLSKLRIVVEAYEHDKQKSNDLNKVVSKYQPVISHVRDFIGATYEEILDPATFKKLYRAKARDLHPDLVGEDSQPQMQKLNTFVAFMKDVARG